MRPATGLGQAGAPVTAETSGAAAHSTPRSSEFTATSKAASAAKATAPTAAATAAAAPATRASTHSGEKPQRLAAGATAETDRQESSEEAAAPDCTSRKTGCESPQPLPTAAPRRERQALPRPPSAARPQPHPTGWTAQPQQGQEHTCKDRPSTQQQRPPEEEPCRRRPCQLERGRQRPPQASRGTQLASAANSHPRPTLCSGGRCCDSRPTQHCHLTAAARGRRRRKPTLLPSSPASSLLRPSCPASSRAARQAGLLGDAVLGPHRPASSAPAAVGRNLPRALSSPGLAGSCTRAPPTATPTPRATASCPTCDACGRAASLPAAARRCAHGAAAPASAPQAQPPAPQAQPLAPQPELQLQLLPSSQGASVHEGTGWAPRAPASAAAARSSPAALCPHRHHGGLEGAVAAGSRQHAGQPARRKGPVPASGHCAGIPMTTDRSLGLRPPLPTADVALELGLVGAFQAAQFHRRRSRTLTELTLSPSNVSGPTNNGVPSPLCTSWVAKNVLFTVVPAVTPDLSGTIPPQVTSCGSIPPQVPCHSAHTVSGSVPKFAVYRIFGYICELSPPRSLPENGSDVKMAYQPKVGTSLRRRPATHGLFTWTRVARQCTT